MEAPLVTRAPGSPPAAGATASRAWWARGLRILRNAAIAVGVMTLVPIGLVAFQGDWFARFLYNSNQNAAARAVAAGRTRPFRVPTDPSITPIQAGVALNALQPVQTGASDFETIEPARSFAAWRTMSRPLEMFASTRPDLYSGTSSLAVLEASVKGFSPREMEYLHALAASPVWHEFDLVARAAAVDIIGGRFRIPFGPDASPERLPLPEFQRSTELAHAAVSRAAYHMALGQRDSAETILRSIVSFGFVFIDNGSSAMEELRGSIVVGIGRDALRRFYVVQHDPRADLPALASPPRPRTASASQAEAPMFVAEARRRLLARIEDPAVPLGERFENLHALSATSCTNVRELLFGPRADARDVLGRARNALARFPSERALVDLATRPPVLTPDASSLNPVQSLAVSSASVAGAVLRNPRLAACTRILSAGW